MAHSLITGSKTLETSNAKETTSVYYVVYGLFVRADGHESVWFFMATY